MPNCLVRIKYSLLQKQCFQLNLLEPPSVVCCPSMSNIIKLTLFFSQFTVCFVRCPFDFLQSLFFDEEKLMFYNDLKRSWSKMHEGLWLSPVQSFTQRARSLERSGKKRPLVLCFSSCYTLLLVTRCPRSRYSA